MAAPEEDKPAVLCGDFSVAAGNEPELPPPELAELAAALMLPLALPDMQFPIPNIIAVMIYLRSSGLALS